MHIRLWQGIAASWSLGFAVPTAGSQAIQKGNRITCLEIVSFGILLNNKEEGKKGISDYCCEVVIGCLLFRKDIWTGNDFLYVIARFQLMLTEVNKEETWRTCYGYVCLHIVPTLQNKVASTRKGLGFYLLRPECITYFPLFYR
uniref:Uncharacterized protein n=1 Tax=Strigamia maritima TaxID=126957 RepID=T1IPM2_STRMM